eukprot:229440-Pyramimonas_sp.AAC.1
MRLATRCTYQFLLELYMFSPLHGFRNSWSHGAQSWNLRDGASPARYSRKNRRPRPEAPPGRAPAHLWRRTLLAGAGTA